MKRFTADDALMILVALIMAAYLGAMAVAVDRHENALLARRDRLLCMPGTPAEVEAARRQTGIAWIEVEHCPHEK